MMEIHQIFKEKKRRASPSVPSTASVSQRHLEDVRNIWPRQRQMELLKPHYNGTIANARDRGWKENKTSQNEIQTVGQWDEVVVWGNAIHQMSKCTRKSTAKIWALITPYNWPAAGGKRVRQIQTESSCKPESQRTLKKMRSSHPSRTWDGRHLAEQFFKISQSILPTSSPFSQTRCYHFPRQGPGGKREIVACGRR